MHEDWLPLGWRQAALRLEATLRERAGQAPERVDRATVAADYPGRDWIVAAWRISVAFSDGVAGGLTSWPAPSSRRRRSGPRWLITPIR